MGSSKDFHLQVSQNQAQAAASALICADRRLLVRDDALFLPAQAGAALGICATDIDGKVFLHYVNVHRSRNHEDITMTILTVTARGQVTFRKDVLQHLGIRPGEKIELDLLPDGRGILKAARPAGTIDGFVGLLAGRTGKIATIEEINTATAQAWAGQK
jgi:bifunctional DNA-binding transcriptional regulator/antitoxin component of YhaV-PrlF toxin-antitoxin module